MLKLLTFFTFILASTYASFPGNNPSHQNIEESPTEMFNEVLKEAQNCSYDGAEFSVGTYYVIGFGTKTDYKKGADWLKKAYENGDMLAALYLGMCNLAGLGIKQNLDEAEKLFQKAMSEERSLLFGDDNVAIKAAVYNTLCTLLQKKENAQSAYQKWLAFEYNDWTARYCMEKGYDAYFKAGGKNKKYYVLQNFCIMTHTDCFHRNVINTCFKQL